MAANPLSRRLTAPTLTGLLGTWRTAEGAPRAASYRELAARIELLVVDGRVPPGSRLPAERELATALSISRTTVAGAYNTLRDRRLLLSQRGSGSIVTLPTTTEQAPTGSPVAAAADLSHATLPGWDELPRHFASAAEQLPHQLRTHEIDFYGTPELRTRLADRFTTRGVPTTPGQILVTLGAQHALGLILRAFCSPGDRIAVDVPTYPHALDAFRDARARLVPVPLADGAGDAGEWERTLLSVRPALAYLMPDFHNPTGTSLTDPDRRRITTAAARSGTILITDETTAELDIDRPDTTTPLAAVAGRDTTVISIGSASKTMWHGLRIGWIRADTTVIDRIASRRPASDLGTPVLEQLVVASVLPEMDTLLGIRSAQLRATRDAVLQTLHEQLPAWQVPTVHGGLCLWANIGHPASSALTTTARVQGLTITSGPRFGLGGEFDRHIRIPITAPAANATAAVTQLAAAWTHTPRSEPLEAHEFVPLL